MDKLQYQKRSLALNKFLEICELYSHYPIAEIMSTLISPIGEDQHPYNWDDNKFLGKLDKLGTLLEEDYKQVYE